MSAEHALAAAFAADLRASLKPWQWEEMRKRNVTYGPGICASHDYCDANMIMHPAFVRIIGHDPLAYLDSPDGNGEMSERDCEIWSAAWDIAKRLYLTDAKP